MVYSHSIVVLVVSLLVNEAVSDCENVQACFADVTDADCVPGQSMMPTGGIFGCCPGCQPTPVPGTPGVIIDTSCQAPSNCLPDGRYGPVQCKGDIFTGRCFCSDENGKRLFGQMWRDDSREMTCACSRRRAEIEAGGRYSTLHCTATGDYERLQCDDGLCWCAEQKTGQPTVIPVLEADIERLPCYNAFELGGGYLRRCESLVYATSEIMREQSEHNTTFLGNPTTFCDYDGSYGAYKITNGIAYCTGRDGNILGSWQTMSSEMATMNCNCARDSVMHFPDKGMMVSETCTANGNYQPNQNVGNSYYCVDTDGYPATPMLEEWPTDRCASFAQK